MILIYSNTGEWGGVNVLIARFAGYLIARGIDFRIVEPPDGRSRTEVPQQFFVDFSQIEEVSSSVTHVFFPSVAKLRDQKFPWKELGHAKLLAWIVHPNDVFRGYFPFSGRLFDWFGYFTVKPLRTIFRSHASVFDSFFRGLTESSGLIVMDGATERALRFFVPGLESKVAVVPIPSALSTQVARRDADSVLRIGYMGRMDEMKWSAIKPFITNHVGPICESRRVELFVVTEGSKVGDLESLCQKIGVKCEIRGYMPSAQAIEWIGSQVDIAVAMGTSALDMAGSGCPCIILDPAAGKWTGPQWKFRFAHETNDYTLGEFRDFPGYVPAVRTFIECISPEKLIEAGVKGRAYVESQHDPDACFEELVGQIRASTALTERVGRAMKVLLDSFEKERKSPFLSIFPGRNSV